MKTLVLAQVFPPAKGGTGRWLWELYRRLPGFDVHVLAGHANGSQAFDSTAGLRIERLALDFPNWGVLNLRGVREYATALRRVRRVAAAAKPDLIHCAKCLPEGLIGAVIAKWRRVPLLVYVHGEELTLSALSRELRLLTRYVLGAASAIVANSQHTRKLLLELWKVPQHKIQVIHPGVDVSAFVPAAPDARVRARLGWTNRRIILTVGALQKRKGQDMMIRALSSVRDRCPDVLYSMIGEGWEREYLERLVSECGVGDSVQFRSIDSDRELIECYQQCDLFVLPNRQIGWDFEGFGIVLLEAQACGKPVVAGASGGTAETLLPHITGEIVPCNGPMELGRIVADMLSQPSRLATMGERAREWAAQNFDWAPLAEQARRVFTASTRHRRG